MGKAVFSLFCPGHLHRGKFNLKTLKFGTLKINSKYIIKIYQCMKFVFQRTNFTYAWKSKKRVKLVFQIL